MNASPGVIEMMSTRLFPKDRGADGYVITGIAARCDWVVLSDPQPPNVRLVKQVDTAHPRHVFMSLRAPFHALAFFLDEVLPLISGRFILISGSEDATVPRQLDRRWRRFTSEESARIDALLEDPRLIQWHAENLDDAAHPKFSPIPLGMVFPEPASTHHVRIPSVPPLSERPLRVLCAHRVREGPQWDLRRRVSRLCRESYPGFCTILDEEVPEADYLTLVQRHSFVICVEGGGLDPSPKAWQAILYGAIPIIRATPVAGAYARLPVAIVEQWDASALSVDRLRGWLLEHANQDAAENRATSLQRLGIEDWWSRISSRHGPSADLGEIGGAAGGHRG